MPILRKREVVYGFTVVNSKPGSKLSDERIIRQVDLNERKRTPGEKKKHQQEKPTEVSKQR